MAYDPATARVVMFGGLTCGPPDETTPTGCDYQQSAVPLNDTWTWDGSTWSRLSTRHAPQVVHFTVDMGGMTPDFAHNDLLLVVWPTVSDRSRVETWTLRNGDWLQLHPAHPPAAYEFSGPSYDTVSRHVILQQQAAMLDVTFWWDGSDWHYFDLRLKTPHSYGTLVSTGSHGLLLIRGADYYTWDGQTWSGIEVLPAFVSDIPRSRYGSTAAYHEPTQRLILFGGRDGAGGPDLRGDTAAWDGRTWKTLVAAPSRPLGRLPLCVPHETVGGLGGSPVADPTGYVQEVEFAEPPSGPCHLHVDVVMTVFAGNEAVSMAGNPATKTVDFDLVPGGDRIAAVFDIHGACALPDGIYARFGGVGTITDLALVHYGCNGASPGPPYITTSMRRFRV